LEGDIPTLADFAPRLGTRVTIGPAAYGFMPHPLFPADMDEVLVIEGGEALIYQLQELATGSLWALKVSKPSYRGEHIARSVAALAPYANLPGLYLGNRVCLTRQVYPQLVAQFPDLEFAVLMPWIAGRTWAGFLADAETSAAYTPSQACELAAAAAHVLWDLEAHHLAHTDIAGGNVILAPDLKRVELLDIENLYMPNAPAPARRSLGSPGYQHRSLDGRGQWLPEGDRFAGALLLTEMLVWWDPTVRAQTQTESDSLFQPRELQEVGSAKWQAVRDALWAVCQPVLPLFDAAWASSDLAACPELSAWALALIQSRG
jgi:hypothetical protein